MDVVVDTDHRHCEFAAAIEAVRIAALLARRIEADQSQLRAALASAAAALSTTLPNGERA